MGRWSGLKRRQGGTRHKWGRQRWGRGAPGGFRQAASVRQWAVNAAANAAVAGAAAAEACQYAGVAIDRAQCAAAADDKAWEDLLRGPNFREARLPRRTGTRS